MNEREQFEAWANAKFGAWANPTVPQTERFSHYWECWQAALAASPVPAGYKLVPVEPTPEMIKAGDFRRHRDGYDPEADCYRAMIAAAPTMLNGLTESAASVSAPAQQAEQREWQTPPPWARNLVKTVIEFICAVDTRYATKEAPLKYTIPYGALNALREALEFAPAPSVEAQADEVQALRAEVERLNAIINTPQADDFLRAVSTEAEHQRQRWGSKHDDGKTPADWFWLVGYLAGKALHSHAAGNVEKAEHHIITTAAACANWHRAMFGKTDMRPGIESPAALKESQQ